MSLEALEDVARAYPGAHIDLIVGSWNVELARRIRGIARIETLDAGWLTREGSGLPLGALLKQAWSWRRRRYDLAINFEPDIRSNLLLAASRASRMAGFSSGGGGGLLDVALRYEPRAHTSVNAGRLVSAVMDVPLRSSPARIEILPDERRRAAEQLGDRRGPVVGVHVSGGRPIKQWEPDRFAAVASMLVRRREASIVLTGSPGDRALVEPVARLLAGTNVLDLVGALDLPGLAAILEHLDVFLTGDTGPMHLAAAVGTPVVAVFGPSDPVRYAPRDPLHRVVRVDLPCSPCNRIRLPPERCTGHTPDCLIGVDVETVYDAIESALERRHAARARAHSALG
jgi:ADP-heptose:LPS heptosyltransferase